MVLLAACAGMPERRDPVEPAHADVGAIDEQARAAYAEKNWSEAEKHYADLVKRIPRDPEYWFRLANIYARTERPDLAVAAYRETLVRDAGHAKAWFNMGIVQLRQAANSFRKMTVHVDESEPMAAQAEQAYAAILEIVGGDASRDGPVEQTVPTEQTEFDEQDGQAGQTETGEFADQAPQPGESETVEEAADATATDG